jgi:hypothetical protein
MNVKFSFGLIKQEKADIRSEQNSFQDMINTSVMAESAWGSSGVGLLLHVICFVYSST